MKKSRIWITFLLLGTMLLAGCVSRLRVGDLRTESQSVELGDASEVRAEIELGAGDLEIFGGAGKLLEAEFTYNVDELTPQVSFSNGTLVVRQPDREGLPVFQGISEFRNSWKLGLSNEVPLDLRVDVGAGISDLRLAGLSLTSLDLNLGAGETTVDLRGDWSRDLDVKIEAGAGEVRVRLPKDVGVRVDVATGLGTVETAGLTKDGSIYTNAAYGEPGATLRVSLEAGLGRIVLDVEP